MGWPLYLAVGELFSCWARGRLIDPKNGAIEYRDALKNYMDQGNKYFAPFNKGLLAELDAGAGDLRSALTRVDEGLALAQETDQQWSDVFLYRLRGEILLKQDARNSTPAAEAFQTAVAIAQQQNARSFGLRAALSLAKLYRSTGRDADAHAVLGPALEGFSPTPEFPEIAEAQALFDALAADEDVKAASASRKQRVDLHVAYGSALLKGHGMGAPETRAAFERARELAAGGVTAPRPEITFGLWSAAEGRGELGAMREFADAFQREVKDSGQSFLAGIAHRVQGVTKYLAGEFLEARAQLEQAVAMSNPARDAELAHGFAADPGI